MSSTTFCFVGVISTHQIRWRLRHIRKFSFETILRRVLFYHVEVLNSNISMQIFVGLAAGGGIDMGQRQV